MQLTTGAFFTMCLFAAVGVGGTLLSAALLRRCKRAEASLQESRNSYRTLLDRSELIRLVADSVPVSIAYVDEELRYRFANREYEKLFGLCREEMIGRPVTELLSTKFLAAIEENAIRALMGGTVLALNRLTNTDGSITYLQTDYVPDIDTEGVVHGFFVQHFNVTDLTLTQEALRASEESYRTVFKTTGSATFIIEEDTTIAIVNDEAVRLSGYSREELEGRLSFATLFTPESSRQMLAYHKARRIDHTAVPSVYECDMLSRDGIILHGIAHINMVTGTNQSIASFLDITDRKRTELLLAGEKQVLEMIGGEAPLSDVLNVLCVTVEKLSPGAFASILLVDADGKHLRHSAAPSLPPAYCQAIDGTRIGPGIGSCGTAAFTGHEVIVGDIATDSLWAKYRKLPLSYGLQACWSKPILSLNAKVLGTFAIYYSNQRLPAAAELELIERAAHLASIIVERKRAQETLRDIQLKQQAILDNIPDMIWLKDPESRFITVNRAFADACGFSAEELTGKTDHDIWPEELAAKYLNDDKGVMTSGIQNRMEELIVTRDANWVCVETIKMPVYDKAGVLLGTTGIARDISERKRAEEALRESENRFYQLFHQNDDAIILFRMDSLTIIDANLSATELTGFCREALLELPPTALIDHENFNLLVDTIPLDDFARGFRLGKGSIIRKDGSRVDVAIRGKIIRLRDEYVIYCSMRDITEKIRLEDDIKATQAKLIHTNKMTSLGMLASSIAHEINNPNNYIAVNATLLAEAWDDAVPILRRYYQDYGEFSLGGLPFSEMEQLSIRLFTAITEGSRRITNIINNMKDFVRTDTGAHGEVDINKTIDDAASILWNHVQKYTDNFQLSLAENLPPARGNRQQLEQVIINLITNALQSLTGKERAVFVGTSVDVDSGSILVTVKDEGRGMGKRVLEMITEPFFSTRMDEGGTGLGLYISSSIIKEHNGSLDFVSAPGEGTTATIRLPLA